MVKRILLLAFACLLVAGCAGGSLSRKDESAVYAAMFASRYEVSGDAVFVLRDHTTLDGGNSDRLTEYLEEEFLALKKSTLSDFFAVNEESRPLDDSLDLGIEYELIGDAEWGEYFASGGSGWDGYYSRHPGAPGIISLSGVGFSNNGRQALLYIGHVSGDMLGSGFYALLAWEDGAWVVIEKVLAWMS